MWSTCGTIEGSHDAYMKIVIEKVWVQVSWGRLLWTSLMPWLNVWRMFLLSLRWTLKEGPAWVAPFYQFKWQCHVFCVLQRRLSTKSTCKSQVVNPTQQSCVFSLLYGPYWHTVSTASGWLEVEGKQKRKRLSSVMSSVSLIFKWAFAVLNSLILGCCLYEKRFTQAIL